LISEGAYASLVDGRVQDVAPLVAGMVFEAPAPAGDLARQSASKKASSIKPSALSADTTADCEWQLVPKKLTSNRQPKSVSGISAVLVPGSVSVASKGKAVLTAGTELVEKGLMDLGSIAASSKLGKGSDSLIGNSAGAVLQVSAATDLGFSAAPKGILGDGRKQNLDSLGQGVHKGKGLQSKSHFSRGHGRIIPTTTAP
jgi:hypothetical protein